MKIKINVTTPKEIEIEFPYYAKSICHFFRVTEKQTCVVCFLGSQCASIEIRDGFSDYAIDAEHKIVSEKEYNAAFQRAVKILQDNHLNPKLRPPQQSSNASEQTKKC